MPCSIRCRTISAANFNLGIVAKYHNYLNKNMYFSSLKDTVLISSRHKILAPLLDEKARRLMIAAESKVLGHGGIGIVSKSTGVSRATISTCLKELETPDLIDRSIIRKEGGVRKKSIDKLPSIEKKLDKLIEPTLRGETGLPLMWTSKSLRNYGKVAASSWVSGFCCSPSCFSPTWTNNAADASVNIGYFRDVDSVPEGSNMGLECGNSQAIAQIKPGETLLDLWCGGGFDCFLAVKQVGEKGMVIGVDMTPEMISKARKNVTESKHVNIDIRLGEIENRPVANDAVDVIISNCVINLSPDNPRVFTEAYRVLRSDGRIAVSDVIASAPLPEHVRNDLALHAGCIAGASTQQEVVEMLNNARFSDIRVTPKMESKSFIKDWAPGSVAENFVVSANIEAVKL